MFHEYLEPLCPRRAGLEVWRGQESVSTDKALLPTLALECYERFGVEPTMQKMQEVLLNLARSNIYHPLADMMAALSAWDSVERPLVDYMQTYGAPAEQNLYRLWLDYWLSGALARYRPLRLRIWAIEGRSGARQQQLALQRMLGNRVSTREQKYVRAGTEELGWQETEKRFDGRKCKGYVKSMDASEPLTKELRVTA